MNWTAHFPLFPAFPLEGISGYRVLYTAISITFRSSKGYEPDQRQRRQNSRLFGETFAARVLLVGFPQYADVFGGVTAIIRALSYGPPTITGDGILLASFYPYSNGDKVGPIKIFQRLTH